MDESIYNLLLTSELGLSVFGTLRIDYDPATVLPDSAGQPPAILEHLRSQAPSQAQYIEINEAPLAGTLTVPLLTGLAPVRLTGVIYSAVGFPLSAVLFNTGTPSVVLQFGFFSRVALVGGLLWQPGPPGTALTVPFSLLARQVGTLA